MKSFAQGTKALKGGALATLSRLMRPPFLRPSSQALSGGLLSQAARCFRASSEVSRRRVSTLDGVQAAGQRYLQLVLLRTRAAALAGGGLRHDKAVAGVLRRVSKESRMDEHGKARCHLEQSRTPRSMPYECVRARPRLVVVFMPLTIPSCAWAALLQKNDGIGGAVLGRLLVRASALKEGKLYVYTPIGPNDHVTGSRHKSSDRVSGHVAFRR
jgi:hypothetical protein